MRNRELPILGALLLLLVGLPALAAAETFQVDPAHSGVDFSIRHFLTPVEGRFGDFQGTIDYDAKKPEASKVEFTVQAASIDTHNDKRDQHLRSSDFFDVEKFPTLHFASSEVHVAGNNRLLIKGDLTIHGVTKKVTLPVQVLGTMKMPDGSDKAGFQTNFTIDRKDYGIVWNRMLDSGGTILGDDVTIDISVEANKAAEKRAEKAKM